MDNKNLKAIYARLDDLTSKLSNIQSEIVTIRKEIDQNNSKNIKIESDHKSAKTDTALLETEANTNQTIDTLSKHENSDGKNQPAKKSKRLFETIDFERFIGENLLNKIGILVLIIGVGIGVKYAIDRDLLSPLVRVINGYAVGIALLLTAMKLKAKYHDFSAVLLSGAMAVFYFITFAAHSFYNLIPQLPAFGIMVLFTIFTVFAAIRYNRQIIAHLGLVGAYTVPFLINKEPGNLTVFFSYIAMLNLGILVLAFQRSWKTLFYSAFAFTWFITIFWRFTSYSDVDANMALVFCSLFFLTFYAIFLAQKLLKKEALAKDDLLLIISNAFIYFVLGYFILGRKFSGQNEVLSFFTVANAAIHLAVAALLFLRRQEHKGLFRMMVGLGITFLTIAIPIQLDGHWVTLLWALEATLLFWLAGKEKDKTFEVFSFVLVVIAISSFLMDWRISNVIKNYSFNYEPFLNVRFLSNVLFTGCFGFMSWLIIKNKKDFKDQQPFDDKRKLFYIIIPGILLVASFLTCSIEVEGYFKKLQSEIKQDNNIYNIARAGWDNYNIIWQINLLIFFTIFWSVVNQIKIKNKLFSTALFGLSILFIVIFITQGLLALENLRDTFLSDQSDLTQFAGNKNNILIRYISYGFLVLLLFAMKKMTLVDNFPFKKLIVWEFCLIGTLIIIASSELINIAELTGAYNAYKMGLTILWGVCSLILIALGILWNRKDFRIAAIVLFGIVLIKLFFHDLVELETIPKTIVFILMGVLLLIISFLYNKFKNRLYNE